MKFPKIDTTLTWTMRFAALFALVPLVFFGLSYWISWWLTYLIWFVIVTTFLYPVIKREEEYGNTCPDIDDVIEGVVDMLIEEDEDEDTKTVTADRIDDC